MDDTSIVVIILLVFFWLTLISIVIVIVGVIGFILWQRKTSKEYEKDINLVTITEEGNELRESLRNLQTTTANNFKIITDFHINALGQFKNRKLRKSELDYLQRHILGLMPLIKEIEPKELPHDQAEIVRAAKFQIGQNILDVSNSVKAGFLNQNRKNQLKLEAFKVAARLGAKAATNGLPAP